MSALSANNASLSCRYALLSVTGLAVLTFRSPTDGCTELLPFMSSLITEEKAPHMEMVWLLLPNTISLLGVLMRISSRLLTEKELSRGAH